MTDLHTSEAKTQAQTQPDNRPKIIYRVSKREMRAISQAAKRSKTTVSQYARQALFMRMEAPHD
ncbi:hypothetical protein [Paracoccus sp. (in: a-proteobacteria)]|uniref:hypothetical protein n=1 Tax=Paracoccus sp. TaxID=267 RepID=UPI002AFEE291|nr:hypothetical protein [Paracoccus sp. (in: a-proteobacteria)]